MFCICASLVLIFYFIFYEPIEKVSDKDMKEAFERDDAPKVATTVQKTIGESLGLNTKDVNFVNFSHEEQGVTTYYDLQFEIGRSVHKLLPKDIPENFWTPECPTEDEPVSSERRLPVSNLNDQSQELEMAPLSKMFDDLDKDEKRQPEASGANLSDLESESDAGDEWLGMLGEVSYQVKDDIEIQVESTTKAPQVRFVADLFENSSESGTELE